MLTRLRWFTLVAIASLTLLASGGCCAPLQFSSDRRPQFARLSFRDLESPGVYDDRISEERAELLEAVHYSIDYLRSSLAKRQYQRFLQAGVSRTLMLRSLVRFRTLLLAGLTEAELQSQLEKEFDLLSPNAAHDTVKFTGYFQPMYKASLVRTDEYCFPIYRTPSGFDSWKYPHPSRTVLEGFDGTGDVRSPAYGYELAWMKSRWEAYMIHVQGSAILDLTNGTKMSVGFDRGTRYSFRGIPQSFLNKHNVAWSALPRFFAKNPTALSHQLARNNRFIFFRKQSSPHPVGSLGVPVIAGRSIATDKSLLPPGALGMIRTRIPFIGSSGKVQQREATRLVLDQDTGSALRGPARVDIFMGTGPEAQRRANHVYSRGSLYYLILKDRDEPLRRSPRPARQTSPQRVVS